MADWISARSRSWRGGSLLPSVDPARLIFARARRPEDILWTLEEVLRSGAAPLVVAEVTSPPALTPVRRMNLAAEAGMEAARLAGRPAPLGLMLVPGDGGAAGAESRWHMAPLPSGSGLTDGGRLWRLERRRARNALTQIGGEAQASGLHIAIDQRIKARLVDRHDPGVEPVDLALILVDADHVVPEIGKARP